MPSKPAIKLMDTTLRDGEQTQGVSFAPAEKLSLAQALLGRLGVDRIEVASAGVSQGEQEAVRQINRWAAEHGFAERVEVLGFVDHQRSVDWIVGAGGKVINLLAKGSLKHCQTQLRQTPEQHIERIKQTVAYAHEQGIAVNIYLEDWSNGYADSPQYVYQLVEELKDQNIGHFMLPDTLGVMSPAEVKSSIGDMVSRFADLQFDFHPHNDYGLATANVMAAVEAGIDAIHCTINCLGERAGNASLAEVSVVLRDKMGLELNIDERHIVDVSQMVESFSGKFVASNAPILGTDVFTQTAGIHADGDKKGDLYVTKLSPERFARKRTYALGKLAGKASLDQNLDALGISLNDDDKKRVLAKVIELGDSKQVITPEDLQLTERGEGNGAFDAFTKALDLILANHTTVVRPTLVDYEIHIPKGGKTAALTEAAITWEMDNHRKITTRGVNANQVFAAIQATLKVINMQLADQAIK